MTWDDVAFVFKPDDRPSVASPVAALSWRLLNQTNESDYRLGNEISKQNEDYRGSKTIYKNCQSRQTQGLSAFTDVTVLEVHSFHTNVDKNSASNSRQIPASNSRKKIQL